MISNVIGAVFANGRIALWDQTTKQTMPEVMTQDYLKVWSAFKNLGIMKWPRRGTTYYLTLEGHRIELYVTEKQKRIRVFVNGEEFKK